MTKEKRVQTLGAALLMTTLIDTHAHAIEPRDAAYYCTADAVGGVSYDEQLKRWHATSFRPETKFVLKLRFQASTKEEVFPGAGQETVNQFTVTVTNAGSSEGTSCLSRGDYKTPVGVWPTGLLVCNTLGMMDYQFNPSNNRFMAIYSYGYIWGKDNNDDTPNIAVGVCTKIN